MTRPAVPRRRRLLRAAARASVLLFLAWFAFAAWIEHACVYEAPALPAGHPALGRRVTVEGRKLFRCGSSWFHRDEGISEVFLEGDGVARGHALASLCDEELYAQEAQLFQELDRLLPGAVRRYFVRKGLLFAFRDLQDHVDDAYEIEAAAMVPAIERYGTHPLAADFPAFHRVLFYQTLYDTGQAMAEAGIVDAAIGCTSFAASGGATASGRLVVARNCDFEAGRVFDDRKLVYFVAPDEGSRYVAVSWAGMLGVVSGVNEHGLVLMLHAARTERTRWPRPGTPVPFLLRDALRNDRTIEEVAERFRRSPVHAAAIVLVAESATGRSAAIETDPDRTVIVPSSGGVTTCANTLRAPEWQADEVVQAGLLAGSSPLRERRIGELVDGHRGRIDAAVAGRILRDRAGAGGADIGLGNRTAVCAYIAAHAVVWDAASGHLHVSRAPRGAGEFVAYDAGAFFRGRTPRGPEDVRVVGPPAIGEGDVAAAFGVDLGRSVLGESAALFAEGAAERALEKARLAAVLLEASPESLLAVAEALAALGRGDEARDAASRGLGRQPVPGPERERLVTLAGASRSE